MKLKTGYTFGDLEIELNLKQDQLKDNLVIVIDSESKGTIKESSKFLINNYKGSVLVLNSTSNFEKGNSIILSGDSNSLNKSDLSLPDALCHKLKVPLVILESTRRNESKSFKYPKGKQVDVFYNPISENNTLTDLKNHVANNSIKLLGICRENRSKSLLKKFFNTNKTVMEVVKTINTPLLILNIK